MSKTILILLLGLVAVQSVSLNHMTTQEPLPLPTITTSEGFGVYNGGTSFSQVTRFPEFLEVREVAVTIGAHGWASALKVRYGTPDGKIFYETPNFGLGTSDQFFKVPVGEYIKEVKLTRVLRYEYYIESVEFVTDKGTVKHFGGSSGDQRHTFTIPTGQRLVGFKGSYYQFLDLFQIVTSPRY